MSPRRGGSRGARVAAAVALALAACGSPPPRPPVTATFEPLPADAFPGAATVLAGFDDRTEDATWRDHDRALFAMQLEKDGEIVRWLLHLEAPVGPRLAVLGADGSTVGGEAKSTVTLTGTDNRGRPREWTVTSRLATVTVRVLDADGVQLARSQITLPADTLGRGLVPAVEYSLAFARDSRDSREVSDEASQTVTEAVLALISLLDILRNDEAMAVYFWQVVEKPSIWSVATSFGISVGLSADFDSSIATTVPPPLPPLGATQRAYTAPLGITVNGSPALYVDLLAADASRPYAICGGVVAAVARHPSRQQTQLRMQLLAARCGGVAIAPR